MKQKDLSVTERCFLFARCEEDALSLLEKCNFYEESFLTEEEIPLLKNNKSRIGIVLEGGAKVFSARDGRTLLNTLEAGSVFGVSSLYSEKGANTILFATKPTRVVFLDEDRMGPVWEHPVARQNFVSFLTGRIRFLTEKIASFTAPDAERKLIRYLIQNADETGLVSTFRSYAELSSSLNIGRASLYRVLDKLQEKGCLKRNGKSIQILNENYLRDLSL